MYSIFYPQNFSPLFSPTSPYSSIILKQHNAASQKLIAMTCFYFNPKTIVQIIEILTSSAFFCTLTYLLFSWECVTPQHVQVCHYNIMQLSFTRPSPTLVLHVSDKMRQILG